MEGITSFSCMETMSIPATVKARSGNCVQVRFHIESEYDKSPNEKYFTYAIAAHAIRISISLEIRKFLLFYRE